MTPDSVKDWANAITAPTLLVVVGFVSWRAAAYLSTNFITPLGGSDGKIARFIDSVGRSIERIPSALGSLESAFREIGEANQAKLVDTLAEVQQTRKDVAALRRAGRRGCDAVREAAAKLHPELTAIIDRHLREVEDVLSDEVH